MPSVDTPANLMLLNNFNFVFFKRFATIMITNHLLINLLTIINMHSTSKYTDRLTKIN